MLAANQATQLCMLSQATMRFQFQFQAMAAHGMQATETYALQC